VLTFFYDCIMIDYVDRERCWNVLTAIKCQ